MQPNPPDEGVRNAGGPLGLYQRKTQSPLVWLVCCRSSLLAVGKCGRALGELMIARVRNCTRCMVLAAAPGWSSGAKSPISLVVLSGGNLQDSWLVGEAATGPHHRVPVSCVMLLQGGAP